MSQSDIGERLFRLWVYRNVTGNRIDSLIDHRWPVKLTGGGMQTATGKAQNSMESHAKKICERLAHGDVWCTAHNTC